MSTNNVSLSVPMCICASPDYEEQEIVRRLRAYGIEPTGNKGIDKARLHQVELLKAKEQTEPSGKFFTISYDQEQRIINKKKGNIKDQKPENTNNKDVLKADDIKGRQIFAIIKMKQREKGDTKTKDTRTKRLEKISRKSKVKPREVSFEKSSALSEVKSPDKETHSKNIVEN